MNGNDPNSIRPTKAPSRRTDSPTLTLYVRSLAPNNHRDQQQEIVERLNQLEVAGLIDGYTVEVWGEQLPVATAAQPSIGRELRHQVEAFHAWATDNGVSTESFFPREAVRSELTGETYTRIKLPTMALAEHVDDELRYISPCSDGGTVYTVATHIESLEADTSHPPASDGHP